MWDLQNWRSPASEQNGRIVSAYEFRVQNIICRVGVIEHVQSKLITILRECTNELNLFITIQVAN